MAKRERKGANRPVRPIKTKRDYEGTVALVKTMSGQADRNSAAERRLQSLLREMDRFDEPQDESSTDSPEAYEYSRCER